MELPRENKTHTFTIEDYMSWDDGERWELIDGVAYAMSPAPAIGHQDIAGELFATFRDYLKGKPCRAFIAPVDVRFSDEAGDNTVVQPDVLVVCDSSKIRKSGIVGAPDLVIEVLSPSTAGYDYVQKLQLYQRKGVTEYWIVSIEEKRIFKNVLENGVYASEAFSTGTLTSALFPGYELDVGALFARLADLPEG